MRKAGYPLTIRLKERFPYRKSRRGKLFYINGSVLPRKNPCPTLSRLVCLPINICRRNIPWRGRAEDTPKYIRGILGMIWRRYMYVFPEAAGVFPSRRRLTFLFRICYNFNCGTVPQTRGGVSKRS